MSRHVGVDLGGTNIKWAMVESDGGGVRVVADGSMPTLGAEGPAAVVDRLGEAGKAALAAAGPAESAGVCVPGRIDPARGTVVFLPNLPGDWTGVPVAATVGARLGLPVRVINDARAFALAEYEAGAGAGSATMLGVPLGTGIGGGLVVDGRLHLGLDGTAGEIGHVTVAPDGPPCVCGKRGCVEAVAKASELARLAGHPTAQAAAEAAAAGDRTALAAFDRVAGQLAIALVAAIVLLAPDRIVMGGGVAEAGDLLLGPLRRHVLDRVPARLVPVERVAIVPARLGPIAGAVGAALWGAGGGAAAGAAAA